MSSNSFQRIAPAGWTWGGSTGLVFNGRPDTIWPLAQSGQQFVDIGNDPSFSLAQPFNITTQTNYELRWFDTTASSAIPKTSPYSVAVLNGTFQAVASTNFDAYRPEGNWEARSLPVSLAKGTYLLRFQAQGTAEGLDTLLDNITLSVLPDDLRLTIQVSEINVCWLGRTDQVYQVQYKTNATSSAWFNLGPPTPGTGSNCVADTVVGTNKRFYRILRSSP